MDAIELLSKNIAAKKAWDFFRDAYNPDPSPQNHIQPSEDFFARVIDLRSAIKGRRPNDKSHPDFAPLEAQQLGLKLLANATSYGVLVEYLVEEWQTKRKSVVYLASEPEPKVVRREKTETPGRHFAGPVGAFIPAAGRLLLAMGQALGKERGIQYAFCDTDSLCFAKPDELNREAFQQHVAEICDWFQALSPFSDGELFLKIEDQNYRPKTGELRPLYCVAVSAKRYALYNVMAGQDERAPGSSANLGRYHIRKFSAHGLPDITEPKDYKPVAPDPIDDEWEREGCRRYQYDLWRAAIDALERGEREIEIALPGLDVPQLQQVTVGTPHTAREVSAIPNLRPFSFFTALPELQKVKFIAMPHGTERDAAMALTKTRFYTAFTKSFADTGNIYRLLSVEGHTSDPVPKTLPFTTINERLAGYFQHPEYTAWPSSGVGPLNRRPVLVTQQVYIGKESNQLHDEEEDQSDGLVSHEKDVIYAKGGVTAIIKRYGVARLAGETGLPTKTIEKLARRGTPSAEVHQKLTKAAAKFEAQGPHIGKRTLLEQRLERLRDRIRSLWPDYLEEVTRDRHISCPPDNYAISFQSTSRNFAWKSRSSQHNRKDLKRAQKFRRGLDAVLERIDQGPLDGLNRVARRWLELDEKSPLTKQSIRKRRLKIERFLNEPARKLDVRDAKTLTRAVHEVELADQNRHDRLSTIFADQAVRNVVSNDPILLDDDWREKNKEIENELGIEITGFAWSSEFPSEDDIRQLAAFNPDIAFQMAKVRSARMATPPPERMAPVEHPMVKMLDRYKPPYVGRFRRRKTKRP